MDVDDRGRQAAEALRDRVRRDLSDQDMLAAIRPTRARRRMALIAPVAALTVAVAAVVTAAPGHRSAAPVGPGPTAPTGTTARPGHGNGVLFGAGDQYLRYPRGVYAPRLGVGSSPTWSPDGTRIAVLAGGILVTDSYTGGKHRLPCPGCHEIAWSPDGNTFAAAGVGGRALGLVDAVSGAPTLVPLAGVDGVASPTWGPASDRLAFVVTAPRRLRGAYTVLRDGSHLTRLAPYAADGSTRVLTVRWSPTGDRIAVLVARPAGRANGADRFALDVETYRPDGSEARFLVGAGHCACVGFQPNLVWSPDGTTLALFAQHARPTRRLPDGDGRSVVVRFVVGSGPLSWQPLPLAP